MMVFRWGMVMGRMRIIDKRALKRVEAKIESLVEKVF
jgi:hypothetical protein